MSIVTQNNTLYQHIDIRKSYIMMSLYLRYQGNYHQFSVPTVNHIPISLLYP